MIIKIEKKEYDELLKWKDKYNEKVVRANYLEGIINGFEKGKDFTDKIYEKVLKILKENNGK